MLGNGQFDFAIPRKRHANAKSIIRARRLSLKLMIFVILVFFLNAHGQETDEQDDAAKGDSHDGFLGENLLRQPTDGLLRP